MSDYTTNATVNLHINGQEAQKKLELLRQRAFDLQNAIASAAAAGNKTELKRLRQELKNTKSEIRQIESATQEVEQVLHNLDRATPKELQRSLRTMEKQLQGMARGSDAWNLQTEKIRLLRTEIERVNAETKANTSLAGRMVSLWNKWHPAIMAVTGAVTALSLIVSKYRKQVKELEESEHSLKALTGLDQRDIDWLKEQAELLSTTLEEHGLRIRQSVSEILQAYMMVGSNKPELLTSREALNAVTVEALRLSSAGGIDLKTAVTALTTAMNQFGASADQAAKYVNIFAAGSKYGAANIAEQADSILKTGVAAKTAGLSIKDLDGAIEMMGEMGIKGANAGTYLNAFLMRVATGARAGKLQTEGLTAVLRDLNDEFQRNEQAEAGSGMNLFKKEFSDRGIRAALILSQNIEKLEYYTQAVTDTDIAMEQAAINSDTMMAKTAQLKNELDLLGMEMANKLAPLFVFVLTRTKRLTIGLSEAVDILTKYGTYILEVGTMMLLYATRVKIMTAAHTLYTKVTGAATAATAAFRTAMQLARDMAAGDAAAITTLKTTMAGTNIITKLFTAGTLLLKSAFHLLSLDIVAAKAELKAFGAVVASNPAGAIATAVTTAIVALTHFLKKEKEHRKELEEERKVMKGITDEYLDGAAKMRALQKIVEDSNVALDERRKALEELNSIVPEYMGQLDEEGKLIQDNTDALDRYLERLKQETTIKAHREKLETLFREQTEVEEHRDDTEKEYRKVHEQNVLGGFKRASLVGVLTEGWERLFNVGEYGLKEKLEKDEKRLKELEAEINKITGGMEVSFKETGTTTTLQAPSASTDEDADSTANEPDPTTKKSKKEDKFAAEKEWRDREQAQTRIAYATGETDYENYTVRMEEIDTEYHRRRLEHTDLTDTERLTITAEYYEAQRKQSESAQQRTVEEENTTHEQILDILKQRCIDGEITYEQYEKATETEELRHLRTLTTLYEKGSKDEATAQKHYHDALLKDHQQHLKEMEEAEKKHREALEKVKEESFGWNEQERKSRYTSELALLTEVYNAELAAAEGNAKEKLRIEQAFEKARLALRKKYAIEGRDESQNMLEGWADDIAEWLEKDVGKAVTGSVETLVSSMTSIFTQLSDLVEAEMDLQVAQIESRYDAEIDAAEGNTYQVKLLEEKKEQEVAAVKNEANRKMYNMEVMQAIAQTATAALNAYSSAAAVPMVGDILAPIAAAAAIAAGGIQVAAIRKQQEAAEAEGYSQGGFTRPGAEDEPVGIVHAGEWVASQKLLRSPVARPMIEALDYAQRTNRIGSLQAEDVSRTITAPTVLAEAASENGTLLMMAAQTETLKGYSTTMEKLTSRLEEPFVTVNTVTGDTGINRAQEEYQRLMRNKTPKSKRE